MLPIKLTKAQIEESPPVDAHKPLSRQMETQLSDYFGWPSYWAPTFAPAEYSAVAGRAYARAASSSGQTAAPAQEEYDPHLRSVDEVTGYRIQANDGGIGHVEDFIVDDFAWVIRYLVVDTRNWLPGRKVLLTPDMIDAVRWDDQTVHVHLTRAQIKKSPEYDPAAPINREYETRLYDYYGRPSYWL
jgi:hypothetical protein